MKTHALIVGGLTLLVSCSGSTTTVGSGEGGPDDDAGGGTDGSVADSPGDAPTLGDGGHCDQLLAQVTALRPSALACCPTCNIAQCTQSVPDVCCSISVNAVGLPAVVAFENAVTQYKAACHPICPAIACKVVPSNTCDGTTSECR